MNEIVNRLLLAGDNFKPEIYLKQWFTYSASLQITKNKELIEKLKKQEIKNIFMKKNWIKLVFNMIWLMEI